MSQPASTREIGIKPELCCDIYVTDDFKLFILRTETLNSISETDISVLLYLKKGFMFVGCCININCCIIF